MGFFDNLRENVAPIKWAVNFQKSIFYPISFGLICMISAFSGADIYIPLIWLLSIGVIFGAFFNDDIKFFLVPFLMIYYSIGMDHSDSFVTTNGDVFARFETKGLINFAICGCLMFACLIYRMIRQGVIRRIFEKRGALFIGIILLDIAFLMNGVFSDMWVPMNLVYGALNAAVLTLTYIIFLGIFRSSENILPYVSKIMVCFGYMVVISTLIKCCELYTSGNFFTYDYFGAISGVDRNNIFLSWGISTIIGATLAISIPSAFYLAKHSKGGLFFAVSGFIFWATAFIINTRSAVICGFAAIVVCIILGCKSGRNRWINRWFTLGILTAGLCIGIIFIAKLDVTAIGERLIEFLRFDIDMEEGRISLWQKGIEDFKQCPVFGVGFDHGYNAGEIEFSNVYSNMYHNIFVEMLGSMGTVGIVAFVIHLISLARLFVKRPSGDKTIILLTPILILAMSLADNFFFYPNFQIVYTAFLVMAEVYSDNEKRDALSK